MFLPANFGQSIFWPKLVFSVLAILLATDIFGQSVLGQFVVCVCVVCVCVVVLFQIFVGVCPRFGCTVVLRMERCCEGLAVKVIVDGVDDRRQAKVGTGG